MSDRGDPPPADDGGARLPVDTRPPAPNPPRGGKPGGKPTGKERERLRKRSDYVRKMERALRLALHPATDRIQMASAYHGATSLADTFDLWDEFRDLHAKLTAEFTGTGPAAGARGGGREPGFGGDSLESLVMVPDPGDPLAVARVLVDDWLDSDGHPTLLWRRGEWYQHQGSHWAVISKDPDGTDVVTKHLLLRLEHAWYVDENLKEPRVKKRVKWAPTRTKPAKVAHALATTALRLDDDVEPRTWLGPDLPRSRPRRSSPAPTCSFTTRP
jgi:hypothetical protein